MNFTEFLKESTKKSNPEFIEDLEKLTLENTEFRKILFTGTIQLVTMSLNPNEEIGLESHDTDQFFFFYGPAKVLVNNNEFIMNTGTGLVVPANTKHNIINTGKSDLKLFSIYGEPEH